VREVAPESGSLDTAAMKECCPKRSRIGRSAVFLGMRATHLVLVSLLAPVLRSQPPTPAPPVVAPEDLTTPRADDDRELAPLLAKAKKAAEAGTTGSALLADKEFAALRELTVFHHLVRDRAPRGEVSLLPPGEPGQPFVVRGTVKDQHGKPVVDALVYAYQTSSKGWYSDRAPHFSGMDANELHARLFGYVRTDAAGKFVLNTIRPGGYPRSTVPEHIHLHIDLGKQSLLVGGIVFDDDARAARARRARQGREGSRQAGRAAGVQGRGRRASTEGKRAEEVAGRLSASTGSRAWRPDRAPTAGEPRSIACDRSRGPGSRHRMDPARR
jgi:protocatechuate 3,4-dioxygenase beta subunit